RPTAAAQPERPEIEAARGRIERGQLGHRGGHAEREEADDGPADRVDDGPGQLEAVAEEQDGAGEDRDDRERDGEVGEPAHLAEQVLLVAQACEVTLVLRDLLGAPGPRHYISR